MNALSVVLRTIMLSEDVRAGPWCRTTAGFTGRKINKTGKTQLILFYNMSLSHIINYRNTTAVICISFKIQ
jgi:hypothetical protein